MFIIGCLGAFCNADSVQTAHDVLLLAGQISNSILEIETHFRKMEIYKIYSHFYRMAPR